MSINKVILLGHLGNDPETKKFDNGQVSKVSLATTKTYKNRNNERVTDTEWHNLIFSGKTSELAEKFLKKGMKISVDGEIKTRSYEVNNEKRYVTEIVVLSFTFEDSAQSNNSQNNQGNSEPAKQSDGDDDLPF